MLSQDVEMLNYTRTTQEQYAPYVPYADEQVTAERYVTSGIFLDHARTIILGLAALAGIFYFINGFAAQKSYDMQVLRTEIIALEKQNEVARLEVARMESPTRIQRIAETELGMLVPKHALYGSSDAYVDLARIHE